MIDSHLYANAKADQICLRSDPMSDLPYLSVQGLIDQINDRAQQLPSSISDGDLLRLSFACQDLRKAIIREMRSRLLRTTQ